MRYHIRRQDKEIKKHELMRSILKEAKYVTLAMTMDGEPYLVTMNHTYDEKKNCVYFHGANKGKKLDFMRANPTVWGQALKDYGYLAGSCNHLFATVQFKGKVHFIEDLEAKKKALKTMIFQLEPNPDELYTKLLSSEGIPNTTIGRIDIEFMSGKKSSEIEF